MQKISACVMTKNNETTIVRCLESLKVFDEVLVLDTGSEDGTLEAIASFPSVRLLRQSGLENFGKTRNELASQAKNDWILMVDSDEFVTAELQEFLRSTKLDPQAVYEINLVNYFLGKPIRGTVWYPSYKRRLYHRGHFSWKESKVHESLEVTKDTPIRRLRGELHHLAYRGYSNLLSKMDLYTSMWAEEHRGRKKSTRLSSVFHGFWMFFRSYVLRRGFWFGYAGFQISLFFALGSFLRRMKLYELNQEVHDVSRNLSEKKSSASPPAIPPPHDISSTMNSPRDC